MSPQPRSTVPVHQRLSADLRTLIERANGERLPTEAELADRYGVSRQTVRRAFQDLVAEGLVRRVRGSGTYPVQPAERDRYVRPVGTIEDLMQWRDSEMELVQPIALESAPDIATLLELPSTVVATLTLRRTFDGKPFALSRISLPPEVAAKLVDEGALPGVGTGTIIGSVERLLPDAVTEVHQEITAVTTPKDIAGQLDVEPDTPALRVQRLYFDADERPVELAITHYNPDRYTYRLVLRGRMT
jgi:DNA-binding GntR family transcriptional regulator